MDIKHVLSRNVLDPVYRERPGAAGGDHAAGPDAWFEHPGGVREVGHRGPGFAYDNEGPAHRVYLEPFALAASPVTNAEMAAFVADDGYRRSELWLSDGWATVRAEGWEAPLYWRREGGDDWSEFTLGGRRPVEPDAPVVHVSYYEADAIARWLGARLPTEAEWEVFAADAPVEGDLLDLDVLHPRADPHGSWRDGPRQLFGGVWEWTASAYLPYPGFAAAPGAVGEYNGKFMVNQHVLRGGSVLTPPGHVRATYRNFFPPSARWVASGVRLARGADHE